MKKKSAGNSVLRTCWFFARISFLFHNFVSSSKVYSVSISKTVVKPQDDICHIMTTVSDNNKIEFYKFLNGDKSVVDLEYFIYSQLD